MQATKTIAKKIAFKIIKYLFSFVIVISLPLLIIVTTFIIIIAGLSQSNAEQPPIGEIVGTGQLSYPVPTHTQISSGFGVRNDPFTGRPTGHYGIDFPAPFGTKVVASEKGTVKYAGYNNGGFGYLVIIKHNEEMETYYAHNSKLLVQKGDEVEKGTQIAEVGSTGNSTGNHSHFEVRIKGKPTDPMPYLTNKTEQTN